MLILCVTIFLPTTVSTGLQGMPCQLESQVHSTNTLIDEVGLVEMEVVRCCRKFLQRLLRAFARGRLRLGTALAIDPRVRWWRAALCLFLFVHDRLAARRAPAASSGSASAPLSASFFLLRLGHGLEGVIPAIRKIAHTDEHWHHTDN